MQGFLGDCEMLNKNKQNSMDLFRGRCKQHNLNITPQRTAIYQELIKSKNHPDSEDIFRRIKKTFPEISLDTVYRTLSKFAEIGLVNVVEGYGESKRYDPDTGSHHHFRCSRCNKIVDFNDDNYDRLKVPKAFQRNFKVTNIKIVLEGMCDECMKKS
jgi:Fur family peroxide stress response transcriptional regulator